MKIVNGLAALLMLASLSSSAYAADKNYTRGSVWLVSLIKVEPGKGDDYVDSIKATIQGVYDEAIKEKVILSYKVLVGDSASPNDWDTVILVELPNYAALDTLETKFDAIGEKVYGSADKADATDKKAMADRAPIRTVFGEKILQEIHFAK